MNYANLIQNITENIKTNGSQAITAQVLQDVLVDMVGELGQSGALLGGVIDTSFVPDPTNDAQVVYIAESPGTYTNFNGLVVGAGEVAFFYFDGNAWAKSSVDVVEVVNSLTSTATDKALSAAMGKQLQDSLTQAVQDLTTAIGNKADTTYVDTQLATKADNASVNAALALKADTSAVNAALATKADTSALAAKADKVVGAVAGNMAALDASGNLVDSGINSSAVGDVTNKIDRVADAEVGNVPMFKADGGIEDSGIPADNVAEQDGYYETMVVGGAENLIGNDIVASQFTRRKTGGSTDVGTGVAILKTIKGNTLVWNQLIPDINSNNYAGTSAGTPTFSNGVCTFTATAQNGNVATIIPTGTAVVGHKYFLACYFKATSGFNMRLRMFGGYVDKYVATTGAWQRYTEVVTLSSAGHGFAVYDVRSGGWDAISFSGFMCIDLTIMFGSGSEPTASEFMQLFPLLSYTKNNGSLLNLTATGLQTNGFNQWDEEWELGNIDPQYGNNVSAANRIRCKNYIPVFGGNSYYFRIGKNTEMGLMAYDANKNYIGTYVSGSFHPNISSTDVKNSVIQLPTNCAYIRFRCVPGYGTTYLNDICINLSDVNKNGTYEPYWTETKALPITTATSGGVAIFSDGMKSVGTAYDEMTATKATKRIGVVDLGTLGWSHLGNSVFAANPPADTKTHTATETGSILTTRYTTTYVNNILYGAQLDKSVAISSRFYIKDTAYSDATIFTTAMSGVYLYYELDTPTDYTLDTPFSAQYRVDNDGTETILPENTSTPTTSPIVADINYALNAIDTIRNLPQNYISKASMDAILTAFKTAGVITNYTLTWDATNQKYNCTITA